MSIGTESRTELLEYSHTIGLSTMEGRGFYYPVDTARGKDGRLYTVSRSLEGDTRGVRVTMFDVESEYFGTFGHYGEGDGELIWPTGVAVDSEHRVLVSDEYLNRIIAFDPDGSFLYCWGTRGTAPGELNGPAGLAFDSDDNLYISDHRNDRVQKFAWDGYCLLSFGSTGADEGQFDLPWGLTVGPDGDVYVADWRNDRIQRFSPEGRFQRSYGSSGRGEGELHRPASVAVDGEGHVYVADWGNERVQVFDQDGRVVALLRGRATHSKWAEDFLRINVEEAQARANANLEPEIDFFVDDPHEESSHIEKLFWAPTSVYLDGEGLLYVTESNRHRIQIYRKTG